MIRGVEVILWSRRAGAVVVRIVPDSGNLAANEGDFHVEANVATSIGLRIAQSRDEAETLLAALELAIQAATGARP